MSKKQTVSANDAADWFLNRVDREAGESITHLALQKLLFFAQAWYLANKGEPLFPEDFEAWAHGPVIRSIWERFRNNSWDSLSPPGGAKEIVGEPAELLEHVYEKYGQYGAKKLERLSHERGGPWEAARAGLPPEARCEKVIPKGEIRAFYGKKIGKKWKLGL